MSLTTELRDGESELARWCASTFVSTSSVVGRVIAAVDGIRPVRPQTREVPARHWAEIGGAWGQRLADLVQPAPPYYALMGMIRAGWVTHGWANDQAAAYPTHRTLPEPYRQRALHIRPAVTTWLDLGGPHVDDPASPPAAAATWADLLTRARSYLTAHAPVGTLGSPGVEAALARTSWLLSACEDIYRSGQVNDRLARLFHASEPPTTEQLRGLVDEHQVTELVALSRQLQTSGALGQLRALAGDPPPGQALGIAGPTIVPHWADGDLLLGAIDPEAGDVGIAGATLIDVKTVINVRDTHRIAHWLWQIALYAWLDTADVYRIRRVGLLLARHGALLTWGLDTVTDWLLGGSGRSTAARQSFLELARRVIRAAGGQPPGPWKPREHRRIPWTNH